MKWRHYKELERHFHDLKVKDVVQYMIAVGKREDLEVKIKLSRMTARSIGDALKKAFRLRRDFRRVKELTAFIEDIERRMLEPAKIKRDMESKGFSPHNNPRLNWYAYNYDFFASEYGWTEDQFLNMPYAAINEFRLAAEFRKANELKQTALATSQNKSKEIIKFLDSYPKRDVPIDRREELKAWKAEIDARFRGHHG